MSNIIINSDKTISINGVKTFPVGMYGIFYDSLGGFPPHPELTKDFLFRVPPLRWQWYPGTAKTGYINSVDSFVRNGQFLVPLSSMASTLTATERNSAGLFGYVLPDEPDLSYNIDAQTPAQVKALHDEVKRYDTAHPTILTVTLKYDGISALYAYRNSADILMWDDYVVSNNHGVDDSAAYTRADSPYAAEYRDALNAFYQINTESISKPIWCVVQAYGQNYNDILDVMTPAEIRTMTYLPITMNVKGIVYYTYIAANDNPDDGLTSNPTELGYYSAQARELHSINNILIMPTIGYSWYGKQDSNTVSFSGSSLTKSFKYYSSSSILIPKLNYILKGDNTGKYLIVVNKDSSALNGVTVTIPSLSSVTGQISILGIAGESARSLTMTNGKFTDNFAAKSVHIYQLSGGGLLTKWKCSGSPDYLCTENATGTHNSLDACQTTCKAPPPPQKKDSDALLMLIAAMIAAHFM